MQTIENVTSVQARQRGGSALGRRWIRVGGLTLSLGLVLVAAGCSSGTASHTTAADSASARAAAPNSAAPNAAAPSAAAPTAAGGSDAVGFCAARLANVALGFDDPDPTATIATLQQAVALAPAEIKPDVQTIADVDIPILQGRVPQDQIDQRVGDPKVLTALRDIAAWSSAHCR